MSEFPYDKAQYLAEVSAMMEACRVIQIAFDPSVLLRLIGALQLAITDLARLDEPEAQATARDLNRIARALHESIPENFTIVRAVTGHFWRTEGGGR